MNNTTLVLRYSFFALITTIANLGSQMLSVAFYKGPYSIPLSIFIGTGVGLLMKYILDKRYIFMAKTKNIAHDGYLFVLYTSMGLITTALFWGVEYGFQWLFANDAMRYLGGAIGLALGYLLKYQLDKRFVFQKVATS